MTQNIESKIYVQLVNAALDAVRTATGASGPRLFHQASGKWRPLSADRGDQIASGDYLRLLELCDHEGKLARHADLAGVLLPTRTIANCVLTWESDASKHQATTQDMLACISWLTSLLDGTADLQASAEVTERVKLILAQAAEWVGMRDLPLLLESIARAATKLFKADRASIFLADKKARQLVGYPALGIAKGTLRVPDNAGIVGAVYQSNLPRRWNNEDPTDEVNRSVDATSGYRTNSLLAVSMLDRKQRSLGVFELINSVSGEFTLLDEQLLGYLASIAAAAIATTQQVQSLLSGRTVVLSEQEGRSHIIGQSHASTRMKSQLEAVAGTDLPVLLIGENGTGKEVAARFLHTASERSSQPFVAVNCAAITETLLESELFGHERGAFTDAHESRVGKFELASGGTLLLDEIGDMSLNGQAKLLRVLEDRTVVKVGGSDAISINVRVIAATNQDLASLIYAGRFREDLYYRLSVVPIDVPSLRERPSDIELLANHFLMQFASELHREPLQLTESSLDKLRSHAWPGNIRELRNLMHRLAALHNKPQIEADDIQFVASSRPARTQDISDYRGRSLTDATNEFQMMVIEQHIEAAEKNMTQAAETLGLQRSNLYRKMKQLGMNTR